MSKTFSVVTLFAHGSMEKFVYPGIVTPDIHNTGVSIDNPSAYSGTPDDFLYDNMAVELIDVEYVAHCYGSGDSEDPSEDEMLAIALILHENGDLAQALDQVIDVVETGKFKAENPFYLGVEDDDEEEDEE